MGYDQSWTCVFCSQATIQDVDAKMPLRVHPSTVQYTTMLRPQMSLNSHMLADTLLEGNMTPFRVVFCTQIVSEL